VKAESFEIRVNEKCDFMPVKNDGFLKSPLSSGLSITLGSARPSFRCAWFTGGPREEIRLETIAIDQTPCQLQKR